MKPLRMLFLICLVALGCRSDPGQKAPEQSAQPPSASISPGTYMITEIEHDGQVTMINPDDSVSISFFADGSYTRSSRRKGRIVHSDSGSYKIEGNQLILVKLMSGTKLKPEQPPEDRYELKVSADGQELRLSGKGGKVAVFRRTK
jgi:hypothetical protein